MTTQLRAQLPPEHVLAVLMDEHVEILRLLDLLEERVLGLDTRSPCARTLTEIQDLGRHLRAAEPHHAREERVLFPALVARGVAGPTACMEAEHVELRALKESVEHLAQRCLERAHAIPALKASALHLVQMLRHHIAKEDRILYPLALDMIHEADAWTEMRRLCDAIGYDLEPAGACPIAPCVGAQAPEATRSR